MRIVNPIAVQGEDTAVIYLQKKGYRVLERNFRKQYGEIDIIAVYKDVLVFVEVKTRTSAEFGTGLEAISPWKIKSVMRTGQLYKLMHPVLPENLRLDAIAVLLNRSGEMQHIEHIENITDTA